MDIMELGAIGALVGGVAVIASLVYVGLQVRQSNLEARERNLIERTEANRASARDFTNNLSLLRDPEFLGAYRKALVEFDALPGQLKATADIYLYALAVQMVSIWLAQEKGLIDEEFAERSLAIQASIVNSPGGRQWWASAKARLMDRFVAHIETLAAEVERYPALVEIAPWWGESVESA